MNKVASTATRAVGLAIGICGWMNGFTEPNAGGRANEIEQMLHVTDAVFSLGWAGWPIGMWLVSNLGGFLLERFGARRLLQLGTIFYWGAFSAVGWVTSPTSLFVVLLLVGVGNGHFDIAFARLGPWYENEQQLARGAEAGFSNQLQNAFFSNGSVIAALITVGAVKFNIPLHWQLAAVSLLALTVIMGWASWRLPNLKATDPTDAPADDRAQPTTDRAEAAGRLGNRGRRRRGAPWELRRAGVVVFCGALPVGVGYVWASVLLAREGATGWLITAGLLAFTVAEMTTRILVGQLSKRFAAFRDPVKLALFGGIVGLAAIALIALPGELYLAIVGFALLAAGTAPVGPLVQSAAPRLWPERKGAAAALVTRYSYTALVAGPVVIGPLSTSLGSAATSTPLRVALGSLAALFIVVILMRKSVRAARTVTAAGDATEHH